MSTRKTTWFYGALIAMASLAIGMVLASPSRLDLTPHSYAQPLTAPPPMNSAPVTGPLDAQTFRNIAQTQSPIVVSIRTTATRRTQEMTDFFGGDEFFRRFFGQPDGRGGQGGGLQRLGQGGSGQPEESYGAGTGFIIDKSGLIVTNNHVVENATNWRVELLGDDEELSMHVHQVHDLPAGKSHELWVIPAGGGAPVSLGLLPHTGDHHRVLTAAQRAALAGAKTLAVSLEPEGGSPSGSPTEVLLTAPLAAA